MSILWIPAAPEGHGVPGAAEIGRQDLGCQGSVPQFLPAGKIQIAHQVQRSDAPIFQNRANVVLKPAFAILMGLEEAL